MSQPTTREVIDLLRFSIPVLRRNHYSTVANAIAAAISKLEALADAEDARPEQPEAMEPFDQRHLEAVVKDAINAHGCRVQQRMADAVDALVTRSEFEALVSRVDKIQRTYHP